MAVRQAFGATRRQVFQSVLAYGAALSTAGVAVGLLLTWWTGRVMAGYLYDVRATDPVVLAASAMAVGLVGICATLIPAARASREELAQTLRGV